MKKKQSGSSARDKQVGRNVRHIPYLQINFSDIPESTDAERDVPGESGGLQVGWPNS